MAGGHFDGGEGEFLDRGAERGGIGPGGDRLHFYPNPLLEPGGLTWSFLDLLQLYSYPRSEKPHRVGWGITQEMCPLILRKPPAAS